MEESRKEKVREAFSEVSRYLENVAALRYAQKKFFSAPKHQRSTIIQECKRLEEVVDKQNLRVKSLVNRLNATFETL